MKRILVDTNVVLDVLLLRQPHAEATVHYFVQKDVGNIKARRIISALLRVFRVAAVSEAVIQEARH